MSIVNYSASHRLLTLARGHPYDREAFAALFEGLDEYDVSMPSNQLLNIASDLRQPAISMRSCATTCQVLILPAPMTRPT